MADVNHDEWRTLALGWFRSSGEINNQSSVRLTQAARLREVSAEVSGLKRKKQEIDVSCEDNDKKLQELDIESIQREQTTKRRLKTWTEPVKRLLTVNN